jgi:hypothetical protein
MRFAELVHAVAVRGARWLGRFIPWLRTEANLRSALLVAVAEAVILSMGYMACVRNAVPPRARRVGARRPDAIRSPDSPGPAAGSGDQPGLDVPQG